MAHIAIRADRANGLCYGEWFPTMWTTRLVLLIAVISAGAVLCERANASCVCCCSGFGFPTACAETDQQSCTALCEDHQESPQVSSQGQAAACCDAGATSDCVSGAPVCGAASPTFTPTTTETPTATATGTATPTTTATGTVLPAPVPATSTAASLVGVLVLAGLGLVALARRHRRPD